MASRSLAIGLLAAGLIAGAGAGSYVAVRQQSAPTPSVAATAPAAAEQPRAGAQPVAETEAVVTPPAAAPEKPAEKAAADAVPNRAAVERSAVPRPRESRRPTATGRQASRTPSSPAPQPREAAEPPRDLEPVPGPARDVTPATAAARPTPAVVPVETPPPPPAPQYEELVIPASSVIGLRVETAVTTERAQIEDRVEARVTRDVMADGRVAIPAGARAIGSVTLVERGGKMKDRARLGVRFHTLVLGDGSEVAVNTEAIYREGESPGGESARKIGGAAVGGAILGALIGGKKGAIVGGATGAAGGTAVVMAGDRNAATLPSGTVVTIRLAAPVGVEVEKR